MFILNVAMIKVKLLETMTFTINTRIKATKVAKEGVQISKVKRNRGLNDN